MAIVAMMRAHEADASNLEVRVAPGVSHTNGQCLVFVTLSCNQLGD